VAHQTPSTNYAEVADSIAGGIEKHLPDRGEWSSFTNFYKYLYYDSQDQKFKPTYGDSIDQLCFLPYEADVLAPTQTFCREICDWWTFGPITNKTPPASMTYLADNTNDWRHYGVHWHYYFDGKSENSRLYPGPAFQLAKTEWKYARAAGNTTLLHRAHSRLMWAAEKSKLWVGDGGNLEPWAGVPNGFVDWRDGTNSVVSNCVAADEWYRLVDTSAYFIEAVLMLYFGIDTKYTPDDGVWDPCLTITAADDAVGLDWAGLGVAQSSTNLTVSSWTDQPLIEKRRNFAVTDPHAFYRIRPMYARDLAGAENAK
jgi:hypothetical protein